MEVALVVLVEVVAIFSVHSVCNQILFYFAICSFIFQLGSVFENAQQLQSLLKSLDKNGDGKITIDDIQLILQGLGLGSVSPSVY